MRKPDKNYSCAIFAVQYSASEPIANGLASRTLAFQEENNFENAMVQAKRGEYGQVIKALGLELNDKGKLIQGVNYGSKEYIKSS